jgi:hypothetical protein
MPTASTPTRRLSLDTFSSELFDRDEPTGSVLESGRAGR